MKRLFSILTIVVFATVPNTTFAQNSELVLEEVVVTATKKEENVQDIAQTVNALTGSTIDDYQIRDLSELAQLVSGVEFTKIDPRRQKIIMRGQSLDPDGGNDQPIQGYIDEVPLRTGEIFLQMYDTERVEILKGAQGTLQGVVSSAGALHIYTRSAQVGSGERNGYVKTTWADNFTSIVEAASDFHFSDTLSMRFAGVTNSNKGNQIRNIRTGVNEDHKYDSARISLSWEPSDELSVRYKYQQMEVDSIYPQPVAGSNGFPSYEQVADGFVGDMKHRGNLLKQEYPKQKIQFLHEDVRDSTMSNASLITSVFTLQFMSMKDRAPMIKKVYDGLNEGGAFIFAEKTICESAKFQEMITFNFYDYKRKYFSTEDIMNKEQVLRNIMKPNTWKQIEEYMYDAGFKDVQPFWRNHMFVGAIAIK